MTILSLVLAAALAIAPGRDHAAFARAVAAAVDASEPLFKDDADKRKTAALLVAVAYREGSIGLDIVGDRNAKNAPTSFCTFQIHLPDGALTIEGWSGEDLRTDIDKCAVVGLRRLRDSFRSCKAHPIAVYASGPGGCANARAQRISADRLALAHRLLAEVTR